MPPRRSSRSTRASIESTVAETLPAKRKRGQAADADPEEKESAAKPTRRASSTRSSVAPATRTRTSTRSKVSLPEVPESDDEEQADSAPPVKKPRPSVDQSEGSEEEEEEVKPKGRRPTSTAKSGARMDVDDESEEEEEEVKPKGRRPTTAAKRGAKMNDDESGPSRRATSKRVSGGPSASRASAPSTRSGKASSRAPKVKSEPEPEVEDDEEDQPTQKPASPKPEEQGGDEDDEVATEGLNPEEATPEEEEERSLLDPPPMPDPSTLPQDVPQEPAGPKSRLVIHKMALVNFKSYAGRQEIGPFHKVSLCGDSTTLGHNVYSTVLLLNRRTEWFGEIQYYRRASVRVWVSCLKDETRQALRAHPQFCPVPRSRRLQRRSSLPGDY